MFRYVGFRLLQTILVAILLTLVVFIALYFIPGSPSLVLLGPSASPAAIAAVEAQWRLNDPLPIRYLTWLSHVVRGDLGVSLLSRTPVLDTAASAFPVTAELAFLSLLIGLAIAFPIAIVSARANSWLINTSAQLLGSIGLSIPTFWLGLILINLFAVQLRLLPTGGFVRFEVDPIGNLRSLTLASITLGIFLSTQFMRYLRAGIIRTMHEPYVRTARAKGLRENAILLQHIVRNALIPFVTVLGIQLGYLFGGTVVIEEVFSLPGMGRVAVRALEERDYQLVTGMVLILGLLFLAINLAVDLLYPIIDPRLRRPEVRIGYDVGGSRS